MMEWKVEVKDNWKEVCEGEQDWKVKLDEQRADQDQQRADQDQQRADQDEQRADQDQQNHPPHEQASVSQMECPIHHLRALGVRRQLGAIQEGNQDEGVGGGQLFTFDLY